MNQYLQMNAVPKVVWVYSGSISNALDSATWLKVTKELRTLKWNVTLLVFGPDGKHIMDGVEVYGISVPDFYFLRHFFFHARVVIYILQNWKCVDVVLFHPMSMPWLLPLRLIRQSLGKKRPLLLMDTRDLDPPGGNLKHRIRVAYGRLSGYLANRWADGQTAITERMASLTQIPKNQLLGTWPSGVNLENFAAAQTIRKWPGKGEPIHLIYIGALLHERNLLSMCRAVEMANANDMKFKFSLFGDGEARADLEAFASKTDGINVSPPIPHAQIPTVLAQAHVGVTALFFPDQELFQASSPIKLFEYMASGLPVLATRMACHSDVIGKRKYAFWIEQVDQSILLRTLQTIWNSQGSLSEMGSQAAIAASDWTWRESAMKLKAALEYGLLSLNSDQLVE